MIQTSLFPFVSLIMSGWRYYYNTMERKGSQVESYKLLYT